MLSVLVVDGLNVIERENKMKKLFLCCVMMLLFFGCSVPNDMLATAVTIHDSKTFEAQGSGTIIDVTTLTEDLNMVTVLTALHIAKKMPTPLFRVRIYDNNGKIIGVVVAQGFAYSGYITQDIATMWFTVSKKIPLKVATIAEDHKFRVGEKLWLTSSPGGAYPLLNDGIFGGWCSSGLFSVCPGGYYTGGVSPGSSGGGIFNSRQELVGLASRVLSSPYEIGSKESNIIPVLTDKKTGIKVRVAQYHHQHVIPILHQQGGIFVPFTRKKIDGLFLERFEITEERKLK